MIPVDQTYLDIVENNGQYEWQVLNGNETFTRDNLIRGTISSAMYDRLSIGNTIAAELRLSLRNATGISADDPLVVQFRAVNESSASGWYTKGTYFIDQINTSGYTGITEIVAYDAMLKSETDFMPTGSYVPITALALYDLICDDLGLIEDNFTQTLFTRVPYTFNNAPNVGVGGTTDRDMLKYLAIIYGGNFVVCGQYNNGTYNDVLKLIPAYSTTPANTFDVEDDVSNLEEFDTETVKRIKLWLDHETYYLAPTGYTEEQWLDLGGRCIEVDLPFYATQAIATNLLGLFQNVTYHPYTAPKAYVDPCYEVGDGISFRTVNPVESLIVMQTLNIDPLAASQLMFYGEEKINSLYPYISSVERSTIYEVGQASETAAQAAAAVGNANSREQLIYISKASGTTSVAANTTWVTDSSGNQNTWTTKRPVYNSSYPVLFVATQRQTVDQSSGSTCTCTTPMIDQTTTVIDGGHITTGTIDASVVNVTNLNASNINSGTLNAINISGSTITGSTLTSATANGSVRIADGSIDFFKNATTTGSPFSQIKHVWDSSQGDSIQWTNSGYTKIVNTGGGQWTASFWQVALNASNPSLQLLVYADSDGTHTKSQSTITDVTGQLRLTKTGGGDNSALRLRSGAYEDICASLKNTTTDREIELLVGSGGVNRGLYIRDANMSNWLLYYDDANLNITKPVAFSYPAQTRANLGITTTSLYNSALGTGSTTLSGAMGYKELVVLGYGDTSYSSFSSVVIPTMVLSTTAQNFTIADNAGYYRFTATQSGNDVRLAYQSRTNNKCNLIRVIGVN